MKKDIHPSYQKAKVHCACGNSFEVNSTVPEIKVEICSQCHPFFTGKQKLIDTTGRVDKFKARVEAAKKADSKIKAKESKSKEKKEIPRPERSRGAQDDVQEIEEELEEKTVELE